MPIEWELCFNQQCPHRDDCLRYLAGQQLASRMQRGAAIYPSALSDGQCDYFCPAQPVRCAVGFRHLFDEVRAAHSPAMHRELTAYLGGNGSYYLYRNGKKSLSPKQMEWIEGLFRRYGYDHAGPWDAVSETLRYESTGTRQPR